MHSLVSFYLASSRYNHLVFTNYTEQRTYSFCFSPIIHYLASWHSPTLFLTLQLTIHQRHNIYSITKWTSQLINNSPIKCCFTVTSAVDFGVFEDTTKTPSRVEWWKNMHTMGLATTQPCKPRWRLARWCTRIFKILRKTPPAWPCCLSKQGPISKCLFLAFQVGHVSSTCSTAASLNSVVDTYEETKLLRFHGQTSHLQAWIMLLI